MYDGVAESGNGSNFKISGKETISDGVLGENNVTYTITVSNTGRPGKGLTAEYITVTLPLLRGRDPEEVTTIVEATTGGGYTGIHRDPITNTNAAEFEVPKLGPQEAHVHDHSLRNPREL